MKRKHHNRKSPFQLLESRLYTKFRAMRQKSRKVSSNWIRIQAKKEFLALQAQSPAEWGKKTFRASYGWMMRFMKRKNIKYKKRKCGKEKTAEECIPEFEQHLAKVRFDFLQPREEDGGAGRDSIWGRFPPEC